MCEPFLRHVVLTACRPEPHAPDRRRYAAGACSAATYVRAVTQPSRNRHAPADRPSGGCAASPWRLLRRRGGVLLDDVSYSRSGIKRFCPPWGLDGERYPQRSRNGGHGGLSVSQTPENPGSGGRSRFADSVRASSSQRSFSLWPAWPLSQ